MNAEMKIDMRLKEQLERYLKTKGITASQLARNAGVPKQSLSDWLAGASPRKITHLKKVADALGVTIDDLCFGDASEAPAPQGAKLEAFLGDGWVEGVFEIRVRKIRR